MMIVIDCVLLVLLCASFYYLWVRDRKQEESLAELRRSLETLGGQGEKQCQCCNRQVNRWKLKGDKIICENCIRDRELGRG